MRSDVAGVTFVQDGGVGGRKIRYGRLLVDALDLAQVPRPLEAVLAAV